MKIVKQLIAYIIWTSIAVLLSIGYLRYMLGPPFKETSSFFEFLNFFINIFTLEIGIRVGLVLAFIFILLDHFYLKKKLENSTNKTIKRFIILVSIALVIAICHYVLEDVFDVI